MKKSSASAFGIQLLLVPFIKDVISKGKGGHQETILRIQLYKGGGRSINRWSHLRTVPYDILFSSVRTYRMSIGKSEISSKKLNP